MFAVPTAKKRWRLFTCKIYELSGAFPTMTPSPWAEETLPESPAVLLSPMGERPRTFTVLEYNLSYYHFV